jgi:hypothetical protein
MHHAHCLFDGIAQLHQTLSDHISNCLAQAPEASGQADTAADRHAKADFLSLERIWNELAQSYQFSERLERFLLTDRSTAERRWEPISCAPFHHDIQLAVINRNGPYALPFPYRRTAGGWVEARTGRRIDLSPTHWRTWVNLA